MNKAQVHENVFHTCVGAVTDCKGPWHSTFHVGVQPCSAPMLASEGEARVLKKVDLQSAGPCLPPRQLSPKEVLTKKGVLLGPVYN